MKTRTSNEDSPDTNQSMEEDQSESADKINCKIVKDLSVSTSSSTLLCQQVFRIRF